MIRIFVLLFLLFNLSFANDEKKYVDLIKPLIIKIQDLNKDIVTIKKGNIELGKSGIVIHVYKNKEKIILADAKVISSNEKETKLKLTPFIALKQDSIPTSNRKVSKGDVLVLGYLYDKSILITPNVETFTEVKKRFFLTSFLHPDVFGAKLKVDNGKYPTKEQIQAFAISQNIGTIYMVVNKEVNIIDSKTFNKLASFPIEYDTKKEYEMPFYTRIEKIDGSLTGISFFEEELIYEKHYKSLLGIKK